MQEDDILNIKGCCELLKVSRNTFDAMSYRDDFPRAIDFNENKKAKKQFRRWVRSEVFEWAKKQR